MVGFIFYLNSSRIGEPDQMVSGLVLHCLLMSHKKDAKLIRVKLTTTQTRCDTVSLKRFSLSVLN